MDDFIQSLSFFKFFFFLYHFPDLSENFESFCTEDASVEVFDKFFPFFPCFQLFSFFLVLFSLYLSLFSLSRFLLFKRYFAFFYYYGGEFYLLDLYHSERQGELSRIFIEVCSRITCFL